MHHTQPFKLDTVTLNFNADDKTFQASLDKLTEKMKKTRKRL